MGTDDVTPDTNDGVTVDIDEDIVGVTKQNEKFQKSYHTMASDRRMIKFRTGGINAAGGKPLIPASNSHVGVVATQWGSAATTVGDHATISINNFNTPLAFVSTITWVTPTGISDVRHPSGHKTLVQDGYDTYLVRAQYYQIFCKWNGVNNINETWIVAYKFDTDAQASNPLHTDSVVNTETWLDLQASPGFVWRRFGCQSDDPSIPLSGIINIDVPDVVDLSFKHHKSSATTTDTSIDDFKGVLNDSSASPVLEVFLHILAFKTVKDGVNYRTPVANEMTLEIRCTTEVDVWRKQANSEFMDIGDDV